MQNYRRVAISDRYKIDAFLIAKFSRSAIAKALGFHRSTISREINRNFSNLSYSPLMAQKLARQRYLRCRRRYKIKGNFTEQIINKLQEGWSPEQISGRFRIENHTLVSTQSVYNFLSNQQIRRLYLRRPTKRGAGRERQRRARSTSFRSINERPHIVARRGRIGDWERDSMYGANRKMLLVCTDRKSRYTKIEKIQKLTKTDVAEQTQRLLSTTNKKVFTITNDNGSEFKDHQSMEVPVYYCDPYKPTQRGTVENTIGLIRQYVKRTTDLTKLDCKDLENIENRLNFRPRKCLGFKTPYEVFHKQSVALAI